MNPRPPESPAAPQLAGLLVEFDSPGALLTAAEKVRDAGYTRWDTHSPFPVHGIDAAMGIRPTRLPWIVFAAGLLGCLGGLLLQWWTNATHPGQWLFVPTFLQGYDYLISGKPIFSLPANIPVIFEVTVLLAALTTVIGMLAMNNLPWFHHPLFRLARFARVTSDRFFLVVDAADPRFDERRTRTLLESLGGSVVERIESDAAPAALPRGLIIAAVVLAGLALLPPLLVAKARVSKSPQPRIHIIRDMDNQPRFKAQQANPVFADGRALRPPVPGTVARGDLQLDTHFFQGRVGNEFATTFPPQIEVDLPFVQRGQQRFNIYCAPCHGLGGAGNGLVNQRALALDTAGWNPPSVLTAEPVLSQPNGQIFHSITNGVRTMAPYGDQIPVRDRWAIVAYVRALQRSQNASIEDVPAELRSELR